MPPGLVWLTAFCESTGIALGQGIVSEVEKSVNQLTYTVTLSWREPVRVDLAMQVWNLFQKWATVNDTAPQGRLDITYEVNPLVFSRRVEKFSIIVRLRERLGHPKDERP
jgi:hypothetical protein